MTGTEDGLLIQVDRILKSEAFKHSEGLRRLLHFLAEKTAAGEAEQLKEYTIGVDGLGKASTYDPKHDAAVRIQVGRLRQKLSDYYAGEGKEDPVVVEIPKGQFKVTAEPNVVAHPAPPVEIRHPMNRWLAAGLILAIGWAGYATYALNQGGAESRPDWTPELEAMWSPFINSGRPLMVMIADPLFIQFKGYGSYRSQVINTWEEVIASPTVSAMRHALKDPDLERSARYTGVSDANASFVLGKLLAPHLTNLTLGRSSEFSWPLLANNNVVYVGAERVIVDQLKNFPVKYAYSYDYLGVLNFDPKPGEPKLFEDPPSANARDASEDGESYALVSRLPGPAGQSEIETFTSNSSPARLAAVQWFSTPAGARDITKRLRLPSGELPRYYQVILKIKFKGGVPVETSYFKHQELQPTTPLGTK